MRGRRAASRAPSHLGVLPFAGNGRRRPSAPPTIPANPARRGCRRPSVAANHAVQHPRAREWRGLSPAPLPRPLSASLNFHSALSKTHDDAGRRRGATRAPPRASHDAIRGAPMNHEGDPGPVPSRRPMVFSARGRTASHFDSRRRRLHRRRVREAAGFFGFSYYLVAMREVR